MPRAAAKPKRKAVVRRVVAIKDNVVPFRRRKSPLTRPRALALLRSKDVIRVSSMTALGELLGWQRQNVADALKRWTATKQLSVTKHGKSGLTIRALPVDPLALREFGPGENKPRKSRRKRADAGTKKAAEKRTLEGADERKFDEEIAVADAPENQRTLDRKFISETECTSNNYAGMSASENAQNGAPEGGADFALESTPELAPEGKRNTSVFARLLPRFFGSKKAPASPPPPPPIAPRDETTIKRGGPGGGGPGAGGIVHMPRSFVELLTVIVAIALTATAAWFSVNGMVVLFSAASTVTAIVVMGIVLETAKIVTAAFIASHGRTRGRHWSLILPLFVMGLMIANAAGVFGQLVAAHLGDRLVVSADLETKDAHRANNIEVAQGKLADDDRQIAQIDAAIDAATKRGRAKGAMQLADQQKRKRAALVADRQRDADALAGLKTERTAGRGQQKRVEAEAAPIIYAAKLLGIERDPETITQWLIALIVVCFDPLAICLTAAVFGRRRRTA